MEGTGTLSEGFQMSSRDDDDRRGIGDGSPANSEGRPRVFVWGEPPRGRSFVRRLLDRFRGDDAEGKEASPIVFRPSVSRRVSGGAQASRREALVPELPAVDGGWDPPDLSVDEAPAPPTPEAPERESAPARGDGHGPGPLYRATLQLLPGRLRPLDPDIVREEIRFVRPSGRTAVVTLGWAEGEPPDHITVNHPSVQDRHARMSFVDRQWRIESLVASHPVRVNGDALPAGAEPRELQSGDEVGLGDASFNFLMP